MQAWRQDSLFAEYITQEGTLAAAFRSPQRRASVTATERAAAFQDTTYALRRLQMTLGGQDLELHYISQLLSFVEQLSSMSPARTPEDQFHQLYQLRKWQQWIPISLLQQQGGQGPALLSLAHLYAAALSLDPLFPDLTASFCSALALQPLEAILIITDAMQSEHGSNSTTAEIAALMQFPRQTTVNYRARNIARQPANFQQGTSLFAEPMEYTTVNNLSPAFAPATPYFAASQSSSQSSRAFLEVPSALSFTSFAQTYGMPSPGLIPQMLPRSVPDESTLSFGFVEPTAIWT